LPSAGCPPTPCPARRPGRPSANRARGPGRPRARCACSGTGALPAASTSSGSDVDRRDVPIHRRCAGRGRLSMMTVRVGKPRAARFSRCWILRPMPRCVRAGLRTIGCRRAWPRATKLPCGLRCHSRRVCAVAIEAKPKVPHAAARQPRPRRIAGAAQGPGLVMHRIGAQGVEEDRAPHGRCGRGRIGAGGVGLATPARRPISARRARS
jgi:hypothetical protein